MLWFKHPDAVKPNLLLFSYLLLAYPLALYGLSSPAWFAASLLLLVNVLVLSAYLLHDCLHNNIFASPLRNERLGSALAWMIGAVYSPYAVLRDKHFRHHIERADILAVNYQNVLLRHPALDRSVRWASYLYLPAVDVLLLWLELLAPFYLPQRQHLRQRTLGVVVIRTSLFIALYYFSPLAALGYAIAYLLFLSVLAFMDAFQHSYDTHYRLLGPQHKPVQDRHYEESNTYSNLLSSRFPLLNVLVLNFCYHNVHHQKPSEPWYRLPALHRKLYPEGCAQLVPLAQQLALSRRYRLDRIHHADKVTGADGVSFLVGI
jgi:acyl-lipid omega-6 desaturase (Delta-12 desaturase)